MVRVNIGVPTYNGVETIAECLRCLQEQSFEDFEVFISDNGSNDGTSDICAAFARADRRFHHFRSAETVPAAENFTRARDLTSAPYFMWRADDDFTEGKHLEGLVEALDHRPTAAVAVSPVLRITEHPTYRRKMYELPQSSDETEAGRVQALLLGCHPSWIYGLWRREPLGRSWDMVNARYPYLWAADHLVLLSPILEDRVAFSPHSLFVQRIRKPSNYHLPADKLLQVRADYRKIAYQLLADRNFTGKARADVKSALDTHIENRVANYYKNLKRAAFIKLRTYLSGTSRKALAKT